MSHPAEKPDADTVLGSESVSDVVPDPVSNNDASVGLPSAAATTKPAFVHLSVHTEFSLVDSTVRIKPMIKQVAANMPAVAVTDRSNMFALVKFYRAASGAGVKPIAGVDLHVRGSAPEGGITRVLLLVQNEYGYANLTNLVSRGYQEGQLDDTPVVDIQWIFEANEGLIALSGNIEGDVGQALKRGNPEEA